ncbi:MAG: S-layer homology domain-containing protein [Candidatus Margulisiibacteriota bacterium]
MQKSKIIFLLSTLYFLLSISAWATVDLAEIGVGARPLALGNACVGGVDDASAIFTNPAGLAWNPNLNVISMSGTLLSDVNYLMVGISDYSPVGKVGIGYLNAGVGGIPITTITGSGSTAAVVQTGTTDYSSSIIYFSFGTKLSRFFRGRGENLSVGASLKYFLQGFAGGGSAMQDAVGTGMDADLGLIWEVKPWARLGLAFNNFLPYDFGGKFVWTKNDVTEGIPMAIRMGARFKILGEPAILKNETHALDFLVDRETGRGSNRPELWHLGLEYWPSDLLAFRVGINQKPKATESGVGVDNNLTGGVGIKFFGFTFDYAYHQFGELEDNATHFFSIGYRGREEPRRKRVKREKRKSAVPIPEIVPKPELKTFIDLPDGYWAKKPIEYLATLGIMGGYPDKTFRPERALTRSELAVILIKAKGLKTERKGKTIFADVRTQDWFTPYVNAAVSRKYLKGYPDDSFRPNQRVTRAEAAIIFARFSGLYIKPKVQKKVYPDVKKKHWASPAIAASKQVGYFEYLGEERFEPAQFLTRAEAAEILSKTPTVKKKIKKLISGE